MNTLTDALFKGANAINPRFVGKYDESMERKTVIEGLYKDNNEPVSIYFSKRNPYTCKGLESFTAILTSREKYAKLKSKIDSNFNTYAIGRLKMYQECDEIIYTLYSDYNGKSEKAENENQIEGVLEVTIDFYDKSEDCFGKNILFKKPHLGMFIRNGENIEYSGKQEKFSIEINVEKYKYFLETIYSSGIPVWLEKLREDKRLKEAGMDKMSIYELALCNSQNNIRVEDLGYFLSLDKYKLLEKVLSIKKEITQDSSNEMHALRYKKEDDEEKSIVELISGTKSAILETAKYPLGETYLFRMYQECDYGVYELTTEYNPLSSLYSGFNIEVSFYGNEKYKEEMQYYYGDKTINDRLFCKIISSTDRNFILENIKEEVLPRTNLKIDGSEFLDFLGIIYNEGIPSYLERIKAGKKLLMLKK